MAMEIELTAPNGRRWMQPLGLFINNEFVASSNGQTITSVNPTTEEDICSVYAATTDDVDKAVAAAKKAFRDPSWRQLSGTERGALMYTLADLVAEHAETLATIEALDNGKPYSVALKENVPEVINVLRYYAGYADKNFGQTIDVGPAKFAYTIKEPIGVCGQIIPWNYPLDMAAWKLGPALCCGNTVVLKLAEQTPLSMLYVAKLIKQAGFPPGVINILNGYGREAGAALVQHPDVDKIAFTGSTATGKEVMKMAAATMKNITLETGGKSPLLVFPDADLELATTWAHWGIMSNQGQICTATSRILVHESIYDAFLERFKAKVREVSVLGDPFDENTFQGPQVTRAQYERVLSYIESGKQEGATIALGGEPAPQKGKGFFVAPTVFTNVKPHMKIFREEIFGPCVAIVAFQTEEEAIQMANDTTYGLGAAVFTKDLVRAHRVAKEIEAGMVWINSSNDSDFRVPFGGVKQSGIGRELGEAGLAPYCNIKAVHINMAA
ncbi:aldehyde dehydrogenase [NAD(P)+]-like protein [Thermochaetoides thermophila DSM 1495]|uniref:aldehyde dehydrogenase (NAD(+)) n=1 Tax=Chaetomium thermophilum (strain DSM 1495 / CBS 144.50 / IMI 039719) TaxID=759272 RepID=G0S5B6_CHATD|nr:aldehyde dehydrogenase [NAD(P)+]-like protein [Thermochaetoides thermophila DSM 1495]EGS20589.1 aldehyde dehydrogenase [NAD(P)+]-like protein [Thermochaetoides thermophila DSM 1495]